MFVKLFVCNMMSVEIFMVMVSGMVLVVGLVLVGYVGFGVKMEYLFVVLFMVVLGGLLFGKLLFLIVELSCVVVDGFDFDDKCVVNVIEVVVFGVLVGLCIVINVGVMLIVFVGFIVLMNLIVGGVVVFVGFL